MAMFIPQDKVTEIQNAADIAEIISETVLLKKAGKDYNGLCPFHSEKTPSFTVSPEKQIFYCFGCGEGGNVFKFLMKQEGLSFPESVRSLGSRYGIDLPTRHLTPEQKMQMTEREEIFEVNRQAADYFHYVLLNSPAGKNGLAYLENRGITKEITEAFNIGYDPGRGESFVRYCSRKGISDDIARKAGLIALSRDGRPYDRFWDRIVFPISDTGMRVVAFGGRITDANPRRPKYINSPETPVYNKKRSLYGLHRARGPCRKIGSVYIVEGYLDLISLHQHGFQNAVATLGTALTPEHVRLLKGFAQKLILVYDSDEAGVRAALRSTEIFQKEEVSACIMILEPAGYDPDSYLSEFGAEAFVRAAEKAHSIISFLTEAAVRRHGLSTEGKLRVLSDMEKPLAAIANHTARNLYLSEIAERIEARDEIEVLEKIRSISPLNAKVPQSVQKRNQQKFQENKNLFEKRIIQMMLQFPEILPDILERDILGLFRNPSLKAVGRIISEHEGKDISEIPALNNDDEKMRIVIPLLIEKEPWNRDNCLNMIRHFEDTRHGRSHSKYGSFRKTGQNSRHRRTQRPADR